RPTGDGVPFAVCRSHSAGHVCSSGIHSHSSPVKRNSFETSKLFAVQFAICRKAPPTDTSTHSPTHYCCSSQRWTATTTTTRWFLTLTGASASSLLPIVFDCCSMMVTECEAQSNQSNSCSKEIVSNWWRPIYSRKIAGRVWLAAAITSFTSRHHFRSSPMPPAWTLLSQALSTFYELFQKNQREEKLSSQAVVLLLTKVIHRIEHLTRRRGQMSTAHRFKLTCLNPTFVVGPLLIDEEGSSVSVSSIYSSKKFDKYNDPEVVDSYLGK
ncbi:hypothetical protein OSTOST_22242, partial [Ostertagia ostertagi]